MSSKKKKKQEQDERFARVQKDPRFWEMPEQERKIKIDKRFTSMFHDQRFKVKYTVDKRGRPVNHCSSDDLKRFYKVSDDEEEDDDEEEEEKPVKKRVEKDDEEEEDEGSAADDEEDDDDDDNDEEEEEDEEEERAASGSDIEEAESGLDSDDDSDSDSGPDLARGKGNIETSSDEDDEDDVDLLLKKEEEEIEHDWGALCKDAPRSEEVSRRFAVCNMDWDRMTARDLLALVNSFTPKGGAVLSVKIYPSEFGKERMAVEESQGPPELKALPDDSEDDTEEEKGYREKMRDYQFKRLKYFYAVVECDSPDTAAQIYQACDGYEYESSCSVLDLRFIADDVMFDERPKDEASDVNLAAYKPKLFTSSASATSKVELTWDETDHDRLTALNRKFNQADLLEMDFKAYLASSSSEEEEEEEFHSGGKQEDQPAAESETTAPKQKRKKQKSEEQISRYRELLKGIKDKERQLQEDKDMDMEVTWVPGLKETTEQLVKKKLEQKEAPTPWEEFLQKKKDKRKEKKTQRKGRNEDELSDDQLPPDVDLNDPYFAEELGAKDKKQKKKKTKSQEEEKSVEQEEEERRQKAEMSLLMDDDEDDKHRHFNFDKIVEQQNLSKKKKKLLQKKKEACEEDHFQVDVADPRFQAMFTSHLFNLDPSHPNYKKTRATQSILNEKHRRRQEAEKAGPRRAAKEDDAQLETSAKKRERDGEGTTSKMDASLSLLIKSIKNKTQQFQDRKRQKLT